ncbi:unnamed protein product [Parnassius mnemosyne]|uniref:Chitin-binding type-2 domain-containing protein n=1 Tax=Parnassius mnemosyne TaxID=213953 RepID=A0AAV1LHQ0_9NEOP
MTSVTLGLVLLLCAASVSADDIEMKLQSGMLIKMLREMANQTKPDTLNLPANSTTIRENITDTFSCENRIYGYYADVDNDCQIFHVCLPSLTVTGRNITYRWSFICPAETVFNQEVLTCTRSGDAIPCEESPMFYDVNMEFGKVANETKENTKPESSGNTSANNPTRNTETVAIKPQRWNQANRKRQNIVDVIDNTKSTKEDIKEYENKIMGVMKEDLDINNQNMIHEMNQDFSEINQEIHVLKEEIKDVEREIVSYTDNIKDSYKGKSQELNENVREFNQNEGEDDRYSETNKEYMNKMKQNGIEIKINPQMNENNEGIELPQSILEKIETMNAEPIAPAVVEEMIPDVEEVSGENTSETLDNSRIASERSLKRKGRKINRGSLKFRPDLL